MGETVGCGLYCIGEGGGVLYFKVGIWPSVDCLPHLIMHPASSHPPCHVCRCGLCNDANTQNTNAHMYTHFLPVAYWLLYINIHSLNVSCFDAHQNTKHHIFKVLVKKKCEYLRCSVWCARVCAVI